MQSPSLSEKEKGSFSHSPGTGLRHWFGFGAPSLFAPAQLGSGVALYWGREKEREQVCERFQPQTLKENG